MAVEGHPMSLTLVPVESAYATFYQCSMATSVLFCTISEIRRLVARKPQIFTASLSFNGLDRGEPFRISGCTFNTKERSGALELSDGEDFVILDCVILLLQSS